MQPPFHLIVPRAILDEMIAQARAELPNECCGLLAGRIEAGVGRVEKRYALVNAAASPTEFESEARSMFDAVRAIEREELEELAVYHSHPTSAPIPSRKDRERNYSPDIMNIIVGLGGKQPEVQAWWLTAEEARLATWEVS